MKRLGLAVALAAVIGVFMAPPASAQQYAPGPTVSVGNTNPTAGGSTLVSGNHWCAGSTVSIYLDGAFVGTATVGSDHKFDFDLVLPNDISAGNHTITVVGLDQACENTQSVSTGIVISGGAVSGGGGGGGGALPFTGSNISVGLLLLIALVLAGGIALIAGRRRRVATEK
ncbi:MAG: LPXTG cell wall anchor domain-containing protein [Actinomycetota bacterium]